MSWLNTCKESAACWAGMSVLSCVLGFGEEPQPSKLFNRVKTLLPTVQKSDRNESKSRRIGNVATKPMPLEVLNYRGSRRCGDVELTSLDLISLSADQPGALPGVEFKAEFQVGPDKIAKKQRELQLLAYLIVYDDQTKQQIVQRFEFSLNVEAGNPAELSLVGKGDAKLSQKQGGWATVILLGLDPADRAGRMHSVYDHYTRYVSVVPDEESPKLNNDLNTALIAEAFPAELLAYRIPNRPSGTRLISLEVTSPSRKNPLEIPGVKFDAKFQKGLPATKLLEYEMNEEFMIVAYHNEKRAQIIQGGGFSTIDTPNAIERASKEPRYNGSSGGFGLPQYGGCWVTLLILRRDAADEPYHLYENYTVYLEDSVLKDGD